MRAKKIIGLFCVALLMIGICKITVSAVTFPDVKKGDWYYEYVNDVSEKGFITGYANGKFGPEDQLTRGQFATILYRIEGSPKVVFDDFFPDVKKGMFYSDSAEWANANGLITGYMNGNFGPNDSLTREQLATIMFRYARWEGKNFSAQKDYNLFVDGYKVSLFAKDAMKWALGEGIISGNADGTLDPQGAVSRAVCATIISRYINNTNEKLGMYELQDSYSIERFAECKEILEKGIAGKYMSAYENHLVYFNAISIVKNTTSNEWMWMYIERWDHLSEGTGSEVDLALEEIPELTKKCMMAIAPEGGEELYNQVKVLIEKYGSPRNVPHQGIVSEEIPGLFVEITEGKAGICISFYPE